MACFLLAAVSGVIGIIGLLMPAKRRQFLPFYALLIASLLIVPVWYLIFRNHTAIHAWFMVRMLAWPMALGFAVFAYWATIFWLDHRQVRASHR